MGLITACDGCLATLTIDSVELQGPGWCFPDLSDLLGDPDYVGEDRPISGAHDDPFPRDDGRLDTVLTGVVAGDYSQAGALLGGTLEAGVITNLTALKAITAPVTTGDGTRAAVLTLANGTTKTAAVHFGPLKVAYSGATGGLVNVTVRLEVPAGRFV